MRVLILFLSMAILGYGRLSMATTAPACVDKRLSENALLEKMTELKNNLRDQKLSSETRQQMVKKALDEMNCQIDLSANDSKLDSPSRWKSIQYQDLLYLALNTECKSAKQSFALKSGGADHENLSNPNVKNAEDFVNAYCAK